MIVIVSMSPRRDAAIAVLRGIDPAAEVVLLRDRDEYLAFEERLKGDVLLLSYDSGVLISGAVLERLSRPAYNFHPAPPEYPGRDANHFAVYEGVARYGATVHEMTSKVDAGPIVAVERFDAAPTDLPGDLLEKGRDALERMFVRLAPAFVSGTPIPHLDVAWGTRKTTRAMFRQMCEITPDISAEEFERRYRAFDGGAWNNLTLTLHGRRFRIEK